MSEKTADERGHLLGWCCAYGVAALLFIMAIWTGQFENLCAVPERTWLPWAQQEEHCLREWISALGGWAALAVGVPTILYLSKQVRDADRFHRQTVEMALERNLTLAKRVRRRCNNEKRRIDRMQRHLQNASSTNMGQGTVLLDKALAKMIMNLADNFDTRDFDEFEDLRFIGATYLENARKRLKAARHTALQASKTSAGSMITVQKLSSIELAVKKAREHLDRLNDQAAAYLDKWDEQ